MAIYPVPVQLVERLYDKLIELCPAVRDWLRLTSILREESNYFRYGTFGLQFSGTVLANFHHDYGPINIPGLRAGMELHLTPPPAFWTTYPALHWAAMVTTDSYAADPTEYDPTTEVTLRLYNNSTVDVTFENTGFWQYLGVVSRSLNGTDPDTGRQVATTVLIA